MTTSTDIARLKMDVAAMRSLLAKVFTPDGRLRTDGGGTNEVGVVKTHGHDGTGEGGLIAYAALEIVAKTGAYTATDADAVILCDASGAGFTVTLPPAADRTGKVFEVKKIDVSANSVTVDGSGAETIDDGTTAVLTMQYEAITIVSDGAAWFIL